MSLVSDDIKIKIKMYTQFQTGFLEANLNAINIDNVIQTRLLPLFYFW